MPNTQSEFPYASLDFPGRSTVMVFEIAARTGWSHNHIFGQIESGLLTAIDVKSTGCSRRSVRVPIEEYHAWVLRNLTGPSTVQKLFLASLPRTVLVALRDDILRVLAA